MFSECILIVVDPLNNGYWNLGVNNWFSFLINPEHRVDYLIYITLYIERKKERLPHTHTEESNLEILLRGCHCDVTVYWGHWKDRRMCWASFSSNIYSNYRSKAPINYTRSLFGINKGNPFGSVVTTSINDHSFITVCCHRSSWCDYCEAGLAGSSSSIIQMSDLLEQGRGASEMSVC